MLRKFAFAALALIAAASPAAAQLSGPLLLDQNGNILAQRPYWQFLTTGGGTTCAAATVNGKPTNQCTTPQGGGGTLQGAYNNSAGATPSIALTAANREVSLLAPNNAQGNLFRIMRSGGGGDFVTVTDNGATSFSPATAFNVTAYAASTIKTAAGALNLSGFGGTNLQANGSTLADVGVTTANTVTITGGLTQATGVFSLTGNGASTITTTAGATTVDSAAALNLGNTNATSILMGPAAGGSTTTIRGGLTQLTGAFSLTGNGASSVTTSAGAGALTITSGGAATWSTSAGALTVDANAALNLGTVNATSINYGNGTITHAFTGSITDNTIAATYTHSAADNYGATPTAYLTLENTTAAANNAQQFSPFLTFQGRGWDTAASQTVGYQMGVQPVQGSPIVPKFVIYNKASTAGTYTEFLDFSNVSTSNTIETTDVNGMRYAGNGSAYMLFVSGAATINAGTTVSIASATNLQPSSDIATALGAAAKRWTTTYTNAVDSTSGVNLQKSAATLLDIGVTSATAVTLSANTNLSAAAGTTALSLGSATGDSNFPTGAFNWAGAAAKTASLVGASTFTISGGSGVNLQKSAVTVLDIGATSAGGASMASQKTFLLGVFTTAQLPAPACTAGQIVWDSTVGSVKYCASDNTTWKALATNSEFNFSAHDGLTSTALIAPLQQTTVTNAATIAGATLTVEVAGVGAGNYVEKLCSDGATCGAGNVYVTCTNSCANAAGTVTTCTVNTSTVPANTTLSWSGITACATSNPAFNVNAHFTEP